MASGLTDSRDALAAALTAANVRVYADPSGTFAAPCARLNAGSPWIAPSALANGRRTVRWEIWAVAGKADSAASLAGLEEIVSAVTVALDGLPSWSAVAWDRPALVEMGGIIYLASRGQIETIREV